MPLSTPTVSVIIVNYNSGGRLARCLNHLHAQTFRDFDVFVVDNNSQDTSLFEAQKAQQQFTLLEAGENLGFAAANNLAAKKAHGAWLAFLNPDAYAAADWLEQLITGVQNYPWADAFGSTQIDATNTERLDGAGDVCTIFGVAYRGHFGWPVDATPLDGECFSPCAAAALYRRTTFLGLGGFDERFFCYGEDVDLGFRLRLSGGRAVQLHDARVVHEGSGVTGRHSDFTVYHGNRNRVWLYYKNTPTLLYWLMAPLRHLADLALWGKAAMSGNGGAYWRAMRDGYGGLGDFADEKKAARRNARLSSAQIIKLFVWSPLALFQRKAHVGGST